MYSSTLSLALVLGGDEWLMPRPGHFTPSKDPVPIVQEDGWAPGLVLMRAKILPPTGFNPSTEQPVVSCYNDYAIPAHIAVMEIHTNCSSDAVSEHHY